MASLRNFALALSLALSSLLGSSCDDGGANDPCAEVTCGGHGQCAQVGVEARCLCDEGFEALGLRCFEVSADGDGDADVEPCSDDSDCQDGLYCDGEERCDPGAEAADELGCVAGAPVDCDDGIDDTVDTCSEALGDCTSACPDQDGDGYGALSCLDAQGDPLGEDCDDEDPRRHPGRREVCFDAEHPPGHDEDCDPSTVGDLDADGDGFVSSECCNIDEEGQAICGDDCDDGNPDVRPGAPEVCDFLDVDENCNGEVNELLTVRCYPDRDNDGFAAAGAEARDECRVEGRADFSGCPPFTTDRAPLIEGVDLDCDDEDGERFPGALEVCDGRDDDCDGLLGGDAGELEAGFDETDRDGDGFLECATDEYFRWDCADDDARAHPGQEAFFTDAVRGATAGFEYDFNCDGLHEVEDTTMGGCLFDGADCNYYPGWHLPSLVECGLLRDYVTGCQGADPGSWCLNLVEWDLEPRLPACR